MPGPDYSAVSRKAEELSRIHGAKAYAYVGRILAANRAAEASDDVEFWKAVQVALKRRGKGNQPAEDT